LSPRRETGRGFCHSSFQKSDGGRGARTNSTKRLSQGASTRAAVRTIFVLPAHEPAGGNDNPEQAAMTAYLISLALAGLVAIALWEGFS
jgi:hypothetical protein